MQAFVPYICIYVYNKDSVYVCIHVHIQTKSHDFARDLHIVVVGRVCVHAILEREIGQCGF